MAQPLPLPRDLSVKQLHELRMPSTSQPGGLSGRRLSQVVAELVPRGPFMALDVPNGGTSGGSSKPEGPIRHSPGRPGSVHGALGRMDGRHGVR
eukprot:10931810-Lingulodinium_polyedra.AAC.1